MRRILTVLLLVAIVAGIGWWLLRWRPGTAAQADPWRAVPPTAALVLEVPAPLGTWQHFTGTAQLWGDLERLPACARLDALLQRMADAAATDPGPERTLATHPLLLSWEALEEGPGLLAIWPMAKGSGLEPLGTALGIDLGPSSPLWKDGRVTLRADTVLPALELAWHQGLLLASDHASLLDQALHRLSASAAPADTLLQRARATLGGGSDAHLLVQPARAARLFAPWTEEGAALPEGWAALDVRARPGAVLMSGLLFGRPDDPVLAAIADRSPGQLGILRVLPAHVSRLHCLNVDDPARHVADVVGGAPDDTLFRAYASWVSGTIALAEARSESDSATHRWGVLQARAPGDAAAALLSRCQGGCDSATYRGVRMARTADAGAFADLFGPLFAGFDRPLWALLSDKVVLASTPGDMRALIDAWTDGTSLAVAPRAGGFFRQYASEASWTWWMDISQAFPLWRAHARPEAVQRVEAARAAWGGLGGCLVGLSPRSPGVQEIAFCLQHTPAAAQEGTGALWAAAIGAPMEGTPHLLKDHLSKTLLVLVQDVQHRIDLISCTGKVLWQRELPGPILGDVRQVDRFRNGKLQLLFNTADQVFLIDRNGKDVEGFPVRLDAPASAPLNVFDYEGKRDYRIIVPLTDGRLLDLDAEGRPVQGWAAAPLPAPALAPVEHMRLQGKDLLLAVDVRGRITVMDRRGEVRHTPRLRAQGITSLLGLRPAMSIGDLRVAWSDSSGAVLSGTLDGAIDTLSGAGRGSSVVLGGEGGSKFTVARATGDSLVIITGKGVRTGSSLPEGPLPVVFPVTVPGQDGLVGLVLPGHGQVRLFQSDGGRWPGPPLEGTVPFRVADINLDGVLELVTATADGRVIAYPLPPSP